jgi:hypothetical protein
VATALTPKQVSYVGAANTAPITLAAVSPNLFATGRVAANTNAPTTGTATKNQSTPVSIAASKLTVNAPTVKAPVVKPCTRFIGKTCIQ